jgi:hypothetical protein
MGLSSFLLGLGKNHSPCGSLKNTGYYYLDSFSHQLLAVFDNYHGTVIQIPDSLTNFLAFFDDLDYHFLTRQNNRFNGILEKNNMLTGGAIHPSPNQVSREDKEEISRIIDYFKYNHSLKDIKYLPGDFDEGDMDRVFGFVYESPSYGLMEEYYYFYI